MLAIDDALHELATARELPVLALGYCLLRMDEAAPPLRALLGRAARGDGLSETEERLLFRGVHILGGGRDPLSCPALYRLLRRPEPELDRLLGDAITETLPRIVAGTFDGDADALFDLAAGRDIDGFVRMALLGAAAFLTWEGRIDRDRTVRFLERCDDERLAEPGDPTWVAWHDAIGLLGLRALAPRVERAWADGRLDEMTIGRDRCERLLAAAERAPDAISRFHDEHLGYIEDVADALAWVWTGDASGGGDADDMAFDDLPSVLEQPHVNPLRHVGRNDPCPCGSGKKAKKCCLRPQASGAG